MSRFLASLLVAGLCNLLPPSGATAAVPFQSNDTILSYGNSMVERLGEHGELEALVQLAHPDKKLRFRSFAWTGDEVGYRLRPEGYEAHMKELLAKWPAKVVIAGFGMDEAFGGAAGLADFRTQLGGYLDQIARLHPGAKLVLLSPTALEKGGQVLDVEHRNSDVAAYAKDVGNHEMTRTIARALLGDAAAAKADAARVTEAVKAVARWALPTGRSCRDPTERRFP